MPREAGRLAVTSAIGPSRRTSISSSKRYYPVFIDDLAGQGRSLPDYVRREFEDYLRCGRLEHGFLRVRCESCHVEHLVAFSCKRRGFCPNCGVRRMIDSAALLMDRVFPERSVR